MWWSGGELCILLLMYSGTTFRKTSGHVIGVHQKIDRIAKRNVRELPGVGRGFPTIKDILHFEGNNGPDGIKRKSPSQDEPWHFIDPTNPNDTLLIEMIRDHQDNLVHALRTNNRERAAFEAAWLAHAIVDGLTPAHHYPLAEKIEELWGKPRDQRTSVVDKNFIKGSNRRDTFSKNWKYWGAKGIFLTHALFELGIATSIKTTTFPKTQLTPTWLKQNGHRDIDEVFLDAVKKIHALDMYEEYWKNGWTPKLARQTRASLIPEIIRIVTYAWYDAYRKSEL